MIIEVIMAEQSKTIILTIVRHGATDANKQGVAHGSTDTPLNSLGLRQAKGQLISKHFFYHLNINGAKIVIIWDQFVCKLRRKNALRLIEIYSGRTSLERYDISSSLQF